MAAIHEQAQKMNLEKMNAHVSQTAEPFFTHFGFQVIERGFPVRRGVVLHNALMQKTLS